MSDGGKDIPIILCGSQGYFPDDIKTTCADCNTPIIHRPHMPEPSIKLCLSCTSKRVQDNPDFTIGVTDKTLSEIAEVMLLQALEES